jgi:heme exporter protein CcmB
MTALAKIMAHWLSTGLPLTLLSPVLALLFNLDVAPTVTLFLSLLIGTTVLMSSIVFSFQHYFEFQIEEARKISQ